MHLRHLLKTLIYKSISFSVLFILMTLFNFSLIVSASVAVLDTLISGVFYFTFEEIWDIQKVHNDRQMRHVIKAVVYRLTSILTSTSILALFGVPFLELTAIVISFELFSTLQYYTFEEIWDIARSQGESQGYHYV